MRTMKSVIVKLSLLFVFFVGSLTLKGQIMVTPSNAWIEGFENGWGGFTQEQITGSASWGITTGVQDGPSAPAMGSYCASYVAYNQSDVLRLITPALNLSGLNTAVLSFSLVNPTYATSLVNEISVYFRISSTGSWMSLTSMNLNQSYSEWTELEVDIPVLANYVQFAFEVHGNYSSTGLDEIRVGAPVQCQRPSEVSVSGVTANTALVSWVSAGDETSWKIDVDGQQYTTTENPFLITGLTQNRIYSIKVRAACNDDNLSDWAYSPFFRTLCDTVTIDAPHPFIDGFEDTEYHYCWAMIRSISTTGITDQYWLAHQGNYCLQMHGPRDESGQSSLVATPVISNDISTLQMTLYGGYFSLPVPFLVVGVMDGDTFEPVDTITLYSDPYIAIYTGHVVSFRDYTGHGDRIAFLSRSTAYSESDMYLDDITIELIPTCPKPQYLTVTNVEAHSVELLWTAGGTEEHWLVSYNGMDTIVSSNPCTITGLQPDRSYSFQVCAYCSPDDQSLWSNTVSATTGCGPFTVTETDPYYTNFQPIPQSHVPNCWRWEIANMVNSTVHPEITTMGGIDFSMEPNQECMMSTIEFTNPLNTLQLDFEACSWFLEGQPMIIGAMNDTVFEPIDTVLLHRYTCLHTVPLDHYEGSGTRIAFRMKSDELGGLAVNTTYVYSVKVSIPDTTSMDTVPEDTASIATNIPASVKVYPNPTAGSVNVFFTQPVAGRELVICDIFGKRLLRRDATDEHIILNLTYFAPGMYILYVIENGKKIANEKIIKN